MQVLLSTVLSRAQYRDPPIKSCQSRRFCVCLMFLLLSIASIAAHQIELEASNIKSAPQVIEMPTLGHMNRTLQETKYLQWIGNKTPQESPKKVCDPYKEYALNIYLTTDSYGGETYFILQNIPFNNGLNETMGPKKFRDSTPHHIYACLPLGKCYNLTIGDVANDGMCCSFVAPGKENGYYRVFVDNQNIAAGGMFTKPEYTTFGDCETSAPVPNPTLRPTIPPSRREPGYPNPEPQPTPTPAPQPRPFITSPPPTCNSPSSCAESCCFVTDTGGCHCMPNNELACLSHAKNEWYYPHPKSCGNIAPEVEYCEWTADQLVTYYKESIPSLSEVDYSEFKYRFLAEVNRYRAGYPGMSGDSVNTVQHVLVPLLEKGLVTRLAAVACDKAPYRRLYESPHHGGTIRRILQTMQGDGVLAVEAVPAVVDESVTCPEDMISDESSCFGINGIIRLYHVQDDSSTFPEYTKSKYEAELHNILLSGWLVNTYDGISVDKVSLTKEDGYYGDGDSLANAPISTPQDKTKSNLALLASTFAVMAVLLIILVAVFVHRRRTKRKNMIALQDKAAKELEGGPSSNLPAPITSWKDFDADIALAPTEDSGDDEKPSISSRFWKEKISKASFYNNDFGVSTAVLVGASSIANIKVPNSPDTTGTTSTRSSALSPPPMIQRPTLDSSKSLSSPPQSCATVIVSGSSSRLDCEPPDLGTSAPDHDDRSKKIRWAPSFSNRNTQPSSQTLSPVVEDMSEEDELSVHKTCQERVNRTSPRRQVQDGYESFVFEQNSDELSC